MASDLTQERQQAQALLERLSAEKLRAVRSLLEVIVDDEEEELTDEVTLSNAPLDDEPETDAERAAVAQARASLKNNGGKGVPHDEADAPVGTRVIGEEMKDLEWSESSLEDMAALDKNDRTAASSEPSNASRKQKLATSSVCKESIQLSTVCASAIGVCDSSSAVAPSSCCAFSTAKTPIGNLRGFSPCRS